MRLTDDTATCLTCRHYDVLVTEDGPRGECWHPNNAIVGNWFFTTMMEGKPVLMGNCPGYQQHPLVRR